MNTLTVTDEMIQDAKRLIANGQAEPVGYRVLVRSIEVDTEMSAGLKELAPHLASIGYQDKSQQEADRQSNGTYFGLVCGVGSEAYEGGRLGDKPWVELGDVAIFERYAGVTVELPPGSGNNYQFMNDENFIGVMKEED